MNIKEQKQISKKFSLKTKIKWEWIQDHNVNFEWPPTEEFIKKTTFNPWFESKFTTSNKSQTNFSQESRHPMRLEALSPRYTSYSTKGRNRPS